MHDPKRRAAHRHEAAMKLSPTGRKLFKYVEFDEDEELLTEIRKHPFGLFLIILAGTFITVFLFVAFIFFAANIESLGLESVGGDSDGLKAVLVAVGVILAFISLIVTIITTILYSLNVVYVTNEKVAQVHYLSIFNRKVMQLSIGNIEDVNVTQKGIFPHLFNYGTLLIETAGEMVNPSFSYVPHPHDNTHIIIEAHEAYVQKYGN